VRLSHRGLCVSELERSSRYYQAVYGFRPQGGAPAAPDPGSAGSRTRRLVNVQGIVLELRQPVDPPGIGPRSRRPMNARGITHLNFYVEDLDRVLADVRENGGQVIGNTRVDAPLENDGSVSMLYTTDADGIRTEVWTTRPYGTGNSMATPVPGLERKFSHSGIMVSDCARSLDFYAHLGLAKAETFDYREAPGALDAVLELEGSRLLAQMMRTVQGDIIELLELAHPPTTGSSERVPANTFGFTELAFEVEDVEATARALVASGGRAYANERSTIDGRQALPCSDPDGVRLLLLQARPS
jgi:catechol 2,3-dioxygenase-like lactoylglutathione lyase family enzyme